MGEIVQNRNKKGRILALEDPLTFYSQDHTMYLEHA